MLAGSGTGQAEAVASVAPVAGWRVIRSDEQGLLLEVTAPEYTLNEGLLDFAGADRLLESGKPDLPKFSTLIGIPATGSVTLRVVQDDAQPVSGRYNLAPAPTPRMTDGDLQPGEVDRIPDRLAYADRLLYPTEVARVAETVWLRDQHLARLEVYPFQYRAAAQELLWHRRVLVEVKFSGAASTDRMTASPTALAPNPFETSLRETVSNYDVARQWRVQRTEQPVATRPTAALVVTPSFKIVVNHDGVYRLTYADLQAAGLAVDTIDPRQIHVTNQGLDVAVTVVGESDGQFDPGDYVLFYGQKLRGDLLASKWITESNYWITHGSWHPQFNAFMVERYTDDNVYWLSVGSTPGPRMLTRLGTPTGAAFHPDSYTATVQASGVNYWRTTTFTGEDPFFWERITGITSITTKTYPITLTALATPPFSATVQGEVVAAVENPSSGPDHRTQFYMNSSLQPFEDMTWDGITRHHFTGQVPLANLHEGANSLVFVARKQPGLGADEMLFDWFSIDYARRFQANAGLLTFRGDYTGAIQYDVGNLPGGNVAVFDVSNPWQPEQISAPMVVSNSGTYTASFEVSQTVPLTYVVAEQSAWQSPASITRYAPAIDLRDPGNGADYLIITPRDFITGAQTLAAYRATQGLRVKVVDLDDVFDQFTDGLYHPIAIKAFLKYAYFNWQAPAPTYVLLVGDGHWNFKKYNIANYGSPAYAPIYMPPYLAWVDPWQGEVDSSSLLAAVSGDDVMPDMAISRLPVNSAAELAVIISKTLAYEQTPPQDWQHRLLFVADNTPDPNGAGDFVALSENTINNYAPKSYAIDRIYENDFGCQNSVLCPAVNAAITNTLNVTGALLVNYSGHGSTFRWSHEQILKNANVPTFNNLDRLPVILSLTCLDGYWSHPDVANNSSLMETLLRAPNGGDVASFSPTGLGVATGHDVLQHGFYEAAFANGVQSLGVAAQAGKLELFAAGHDRDLLSTYTIFGDPALRLPTYRLDVAPANSVRFGLSNTTITHTLQITNVSLLTHTGFVAITGNVWPVTASQVNLMLPAGQSMPLVISVTIPADAPWGASDGMTVTFRSTDNVVQATAQFTTINGLYGMIVANHPDAQLAEPSATVTYTVQITNAGVLTDTFDLSYSGNAWPVQLSTSQVTDLPPNGSAEFQVMVSAPDHALADQFDVAQIDLSSQGSSGFLSAATRLTTTIKAVYGFELTPAALAQVGLSGQTVTYSLALTNTGNVTNAFTADVGEAVWPTAISPTIGSIAPWSRVEVPVLVNLPSGVGQGVVDTATVTVTMSLGGLGPQHVYMVTLANPYQVALPLVIKGN